MNCFKFLSFALAVCAVLSPPAVSAQNAQAAPPPGQPALEEHSLPLRMLNGVIILDNFERFQDNLSTDTNKMGNAVVVEGPGFLRQHESRVRARMKPFVGKPLTQEQLRLMQQTLILLCRELDRYWVDVYYPPQQVENGVVQIMVYEGFLGRVSAVYPGRRWFSEKFITNSIHLRRGDSISQKSLLADVNRLNSADPQFLEVNIDLKLGEFHEQGSTNTDIDMRVRDRFPLRVFVGYDDYGVRELGENRVYSGLDYGNLWGIAHQFHYQYTTDLDFDHLRSHTASYIAPFSWGHSLALFGGYSDLNADLSPVSSALRSSGKAYQMSLRYTIPLPKLGKLDQDISAQFDFKYANTPLQFNQVALNSFRAAIDQFVVTYHARLQDNFGSTELSASGYYSPGDMLGPNTTADFRTYAPTENNDLTANYYYGRVNGERVFAAKFLPLHSFLDFRGGYQAASERLLPSEEWYLGGDQALRGYAENVVAGSEGYNATAEWHLPIFPNLAFFGTNQPNLTRQHDLPRVTGDTLDVFGFYDYGAVRPSGEESARYYLESAGGGLKLAISQNLEVNFAYGFGLKRLPVETYGPTPLLDSHRRGALISATLRY
jgi:hemolysin activation/secretion protein